MVSNKLQIGIECCFYIGILNISNTNSFLLDYSLKPNKPKNLKKKFFYASFVLIPPFSSIE